MVAVTDANEGSWILLRVADPLAWINHDPIALKRTKLLLLVPRDLGDVPHFYGLQKPNYVIPG